MNNERSRARRLDLGIALSITLVLPSALLVTGDPLHIGAWYYLLVAATALALGLFLGSPPLFLTGATGAAAITLMIYALINLRHAEGLLVLGHLFSLPGAALGLLIGALASKRKPKHLTALFLGMGATLLGFFLNQLLICNWLMWCGPLSLPPA